MNASNVIFSASVPKEEIGKIKYDTKEVEDVLDDGSKIIYPSFGAQYAEIKIDSINLDAPVYWGDTEELLQQGVCQYTGSVYLGMKGNVVLAAHCNTFFYHLGEMKVGDTVVITTSYGEFTYRMAEQVLFKETDNGLCLSYGGRSSYALYLLWQPFGSYRGQTGRYMRAC